MLTACSAEGNVPPGFLTNVLTMEGLDTSGKNCHGIHLGQVCAGMGQSSLSSVPACLHCVCDSTSHSVPLTQTTGKRIYL